MLNKHWNSNIVRVMSYWILEFVKLRELLQHILRLRSKIKKASLSKITKLFQIIGVGISAPNELMIPLKSFYIGLVGSTTILPELFCSGFLIKIICQSLWGLKSTGPNLHINKTTKWRILAGSCSKMMRLCNILVLNVLTEPELRVG